MLVSLLRHGIPTSLKTRAIRNGSSTATGFPGSSRRKEERIEGWTSATGADQKRKTVCKTPKQPREGRIRYFNTHTSLKHAEKSKVEEEREGKDRARSNCGVEVISQESPSDRLHSLRNEWEVCQAAPSRGDVHSKMALSSEKDATSSRSIVKNSQARPAHDEEPVHRTNSDSKFFEELQEQNMVGGEDVAVNDSGQAPQQSTEADSSFLDGLNKEISQKKAIKILQESIPITQKLATLRQLMVTNDSRNLLMYMTHHIADVEFMRAIPELTFVEVLRQLEPRDEFLPLRSEYKELGPKHYGMLFKWREKTYKALQERRKSYHDIMMVRIESGATLAVGEYTQLLNLARSTWDGPTALLIMKNMIANEVKPNLSCYNHYFEARCWSDAYHPIESHRLRVLPRNTEMRKGNHNGYFVGNMKVEGHSVDEDGIHWEVTQMFTKLVNEGINADTRAYCNLIIAQSREGHINAIKSVLKHVWDTDVDALLAGEPGYNQKNLREDSPTYPNEDLLYALAHAFGSNNDISAAMQIVAHFSSKYGISISQAVWSELLEWSFVLSTPRRKSSLKNGDTTGQLPLRSVESLFNVMIKPPYEGKPTMRMYDFLLRSFWRKPLNHRTLFDFVYSMRDGVKFDEQAREAFLEAQHKLNGMLKGGRATDPIILDFQHAEVAKASREQAYTFALAVKWLELLLSNHRWLRNVAERERKWTRTLLPKVIKEFYRFKAHRPFIYPISTGRVELEDPAFEQRSQIRHLAREGNPSHEMEDWNSGYAMWSKNSEYVKDHEVKMESFNKNDEMEA